MPPSRSAGTWSCVIPPGARGRPRQSVRLISLSAQTLMPDASIDSPSSNVPRRSKRQSLAWGSLADACLPDFTGPTSFFQSAEPDTAASSWTRSALREFITVTITLTAGLALGFGAACAVRPNRVAPASAAASVRVFIRFTPQHHHRGGDLYAHCVNRLLKRIQIVHRRRVSGFAAMQIQGWPGWQTQRNPGTLRLQAAVVSQPPSRPEPPLTLRAASTPRARRPFFVRPKGRRAARCSDSAVLKRSIVIGKQAAEQYRAALRIRPRFGGASFLAGPDL